MIRSRHKIESITLTAMLSGISFVLLTPLRLGIFDSSVFFLVFFLAGYILLQRSSFRYVIYYITSSLTLSFLLVPLLTVVGLSISAIGASLSILIIEKWGLSIYSITLMSLTLVISTFCSLYISSIFLEINPIKTYNSTLRALFTDLSKRHSSISYLFTLLSQMSFSLILLVFLLNDVLITALSLVLLLALSRSLSFKVKTRFRNPLRSLSLIYVLLLIPSSLFLIYINKYNDLIYLILSIILTLYLTYSVLLSLVLPVTILQKKKKVGVPFFLTFLLAIILAPLSAVLSLSLLYRLKLKLSQSFS